MDQTLANYFENLLHAAKGVLSVENKNWPLYVRSELAQLRTMVERVEERKELLNKRIDELLSNQTIQRNYVAHDIDEIHENSY